MITTIITASAWTLTSCCGLTAVSDYAVIARTRGGWRWREGLWTAPLAFTSATAASLAWLGAVAPGLGAIAAAVPAVAVALMEGRAWWEQAGAHGKLRAARIVLSGLLARLRLGALYAFDDLRALARALRRDGEPAEPSPATSVLPPPAERPVRQAPPPPAQVPQEPQPAGPPPAQPEPADAGPPAAAMSPGWAGLCAEIDGFEPDADEEVLGFLAAQLAGHIGHAESVRDLADRLFHGTGLDPAFAQGVAEYADENAEMTGEVAVLDRQFHAIYDTLRAWVDEHPMGMPHRAREFLQGGEPPLPEAGDDGIAA